MLRKVLLVLFLVLLLISFSIASAGPANHDDDGGPGPLEIINGQLAAQGLNIRAVMIEYFTIGEGRPSNRILQQPFRWVPNDPRRLADGNNITYLVVQENGATASGLTNADTEPAIDRSMATWDSQQCFRRVSIVKRPDTGANATIFDSFFGFGTAGDPFLADIVSAGWYPRQYFELVGGPGGGDGILAFSVTFTFVDEFGNPSDINNDGYIDTALNEVYYNDTFGDPNGNRANNPWGINIALPGIDVETVALHENGHSLGVGHFGPPPSAVMNPVYSGIQHAPGATDNAGMCTIWASWPNR